VGYIGRFKYDFDGKYIFESNFRYDGNDNFPSSKRFGLFPSLSAGWNISKENFAQPILDKVGLSSLKLRGSWGILGSANNVGRFAYIPVYNLNQNNYFLNGKYITGFSEGNLVSDALTWSENEARNIALDFGFMDNKLTGTVEWFYNRLTGFIGNPQDQYTTPLGKNLPQVNTDSAKRKEGIELMLNYKDSFGDVDFYASGNISYFDQLWEKRYDEQESSLKNPYSRLTGQKDYYTTGYTSLGYYQSLDQIINSPRRLGSTQTMLGDLMYEDKNGDGRIDGDDFRRIGKADFPHVTYGLNLGANYKGFGLDMLFQGTSNRQMYLGGIWNNELNHKIYKIQDNDWRPDNTDALFPRTSTFNGVNGNNNRVRSTFWLKDAWYLRMKSARLSYDFKHSLLKDSSFNSFSLVFSATNIFTISPIKKYHLDPETSSADNYGYPIQSTFNLGLRVGF
jgi:TonB-linked SusC/RagA family outer membrane protein